MENIKKFSVDYLIFLLKEVIEFNEINLELIFAKNKNITSPKPIDINNINNWIDNNIYIGN